MDDTASVKIVGDASGVQPAVDATKTSVESIGPALEALTAGFAEFASQMSASMAQGAASVKPLKDALSGMHGALDEASLGFVGMVSHIHEAAESVRTFQARAAEFAEVYVSMFAVDRITEFMQSMGEAAETVEHLSKQFGLTTAQVQGLQGVALSTGVSLDTITRAMEVLDKNAATASGSTSSMSKALAAVGISAGDGRDQMQRLIQVAGTFQGLADGPQKAALAMELFGRSGKDLIPVLDQGAQGIQALLDKAQEYGLVSDDAQEKGLKLAESVNESRIAWAGMKNTLADALAPLLTQIAEGFESLVEQMVQSYEQGGAVKQMFDALTVSAQLVGQTMGVVDEIVSTLYQHMNLLAPVVGGVAAVFAGKLVLGLGEALIGTKNLLIAQAALTLAYEEGGVVAVFSAAITGLVEAMKALTVATIETSVALLATPWGALAVAVGALIVLYEKMTQETEEQKTADDDLKAAKDKLADAQGNLAGKSRDALEAMKAETQQTLDQAQAHLQAAKAALEQAEAEALIANKGINRAEIMPDDLGSSTPSIDRAVAADDNVGKAQQAYNNEKKSVDDLLASITTLNAQIAKTPAPKFGDNIDISPTPKEKKPKDDLVQQLEAELTEKKLAWDQEQDAQNTAQAYSLQSEKDFWAQALTLQDLSAKDREAIETKYLAASQKIRQQEVTAQLEVYKQEEAAAGKNSDAKLTIAEKESTYLGHMFGLQSDQYKEALAHQAQAAQAAAEEIKQIAEEAANHTAQMQKLALDQNVSDAKFRVAMGKETNDQLIQDEIRAANEEWAAEKARYDKDIEAARANKLEHDKLLDQQAAAEAQYNTKVAQLNQQAALQQKQVAQQLFQPFSNELGKMLTAQETFAQGFSNMWSSLANVVGRAISNMVEGFLEALIVQDAASGTLHAKEMLRHAEEAAAAAYKATAGIPIVGPVLAPIAAVAAFAGVMAFGSAEGGDWNVTPGMYELHKNEMVLPEWAATPLRSMVSSYGSGWSLPAGISAGYSPAANSNAPAPANVNGGGPAHHFYGPVIMGDLRAIDTQSGAQFLMRNKTHVAAATKSAVRYGFNTGK